VFAEHILIEQTGQAVDGVRRGQERLLAQLRRPQGGGAGHDGLADAALSAEEHVLEVRPLRDELRHRFGDRGAVRLRGCSRGTRRFGGSGHPYMIPASFSMAGNPVTSRSSSGTWASTWLPSVRLISDKYRCCMLMRFFK